MDNAFYILLGNQLVGPYLLSQIQQMVQAGQLQPLTLVKSCNNDQLYRVQDLIMPQNTPVFPGNIPNAPGTNFVPGSVPPMAPYNYQPQTNAQYQNPPQQNPVYTNWGNNQASQVPGLNMVMPSGQPLPNQQIPMVPPPVPPSVQSFPKNPQEAQASQVSLANQPHFDSNFISDSQDNIKPGAPTPPMVAPLVSPMPQQATSENTNRDVVTVEQNDIDKKTDSPVVSPLVTVANNDVTLPPKVTMRSWIDRSNPENGTIVCPHCWGKCSMETILFIAMHPELNGDALLGNDVQQRFLPKYYTSKGTALDAKGMECTDMACPYCHLKIPNAVIDLPSSVFSIVGAPASGKSYFLTSMIWELRKSLPKYFNFSIYDTDPSFNMVLNNYEKILFILRTREK